MDRVIEELTSWLKSLLVDGVMSVLQGMFDSVNNQVGEVTTQVATTPAAFQANVFNLIKELSEGVIMPIAGMVLTFIACYELIQLIIAHNNLANFETWIFFKWIFKTFIAVMLISNCFDISMAVFDVAQHVVNSSGALIQGSTAVDDSALAGMRATIEAMDLAAIFGLFFQVLFVNLATQILAAFIFVVVYGRMVEIYLMISLAPIPFATFGNREQSQIGQNYLRGLIALGFQGFLIMVCMGIYAALIQSVAFTDDIVGSMWGVLGYTVLLCFSLLKTSSLSKSIFSAR
ncbi:MULTISPECIES: VirB6/TrbL-like conjugal transfer protein, CD1112 family [unclassified Butyrivibrio]|uniref:VirB6/TrbL-like conjugal transfer protein, CD1112 family n=1 Tax=unclassified Butyrivibrio TaxID=2639466 RepID=UPI000423602B|nr:MULTISPECIES: CD0415/CD1112 family protein [unclassified Butyrivibrio]